MDIFIAGDLTTCAPSLALSLLADGHHVVTSSENDGVKGVSHKHYTPFRMAFNNPLYPEIFTAHSFDLVIHIMNRAGARQSSSEQTVSPTNTAQLESALQLAKHTGVERFILLTSIDVYGTVIDLLEDVQPQPSGPISQVFLNAENLCKSYADESFNVSIIRVPLLYGPEEDYTLLAQLIQQSRNKINVKIPFGKHTHCNFVHIDDLFSLVRLIIEDQDPNRINIFNLGTEDINFSFLSQQLSIHFPGVTYHFPESQDEPSNHKKVSSKNARQLYGWQPQHTLINDIPLLIDAGTETTRARQSFAAKIGAFAAGLRPFLVWVEVLLGAFLMHMLTVWTSTIIEFKVIDYRLLFVVLIGSIHGLLFGIIAAILAAASAVIAWDNIGLDFALLIYNVENWIPFAVYFLAGAVTGYVHDKHENDLQFEKHQTELIHEKYSFLYELYNQISSIKNRLREQLVGYRDSFGRFFRIANELNELDEDNIFYKALEILEDLMKNDQIAIYSIESTGHFGRLQVSSKSITRDIPKSMRLDDYAGALPLLTSGEVFQNKDLVANYPAYIAPIMNANELIGLVIIWEASFEQFNMYYYNLFKVITGLIQSSLVRAATFENARYEQLFLPGTRIMRPDAFKQTFTIRNKMRRNKVSEFQILRIPRKENSWSEIFEMLSGSIRSEDVVGILDENADTCYIILSNAGIENIGMIQERMKSNGISSEYVPELELD